MPPNRRSNGSLRRRNGATSGDSGVSKRPATTSQEAVRRVPTARRAQTPEIPTPESGACPKFTTINSSSQRSVSHAVRMAGPLTNPSPPQLRRFSSTASSTWSDKENRPFNGPLGTKRTRDDDDPKLPASRREYAWDGTRRRERVVSQWEEVLDVAVDRVKAQIFTGRADVEGCNLNLGMFPEEKKEGLNTFITALWHNIVETKYMPERIQRDRIPTRPPKDEARKIYDAISNFRSSSMAIVRRTVATILYEGVDRIQAENCGSTTKMQRLVKGLLFNDRWTCLDERSEKGRFFSKTICRNIASVFFGAGSDDRGSLAARPETRDYFRKLTAEGVLWVCGMVHHAIAEFECGKHVQVKYMSSVIRKTTERLKKSWDQITQRKQRFCLDYIKAYILDHGHVSGGYEVEAVDDPYKDSMLDLVEIGIASSADADGVTAEELFDNDISTTDGDNRTDYDVEIDEGGENGNEEADSDPIRKGIDERRARQHERRVREQLSEFQYAYYWAEEVAEDTPVGLREKEYGKPLSSKLSYMEWLRVLRMDEASQCWYRLPAATHGSAGRTPVVIDSEAAYVEMLRRVYANGLCVELQSSGLDDFASPRR